MLAMATTERIAATIQGVRLPPGAAAPPTPLRAVVPAAAAPQPGQNRASAVSGVPQELQALGPSGVPQEAQKFPDAAAPQLGQVDEVLGVTVSPEMCR